MSEFKGPIIEGAYYLREDRSVIFLPKNHVYCYANQPGGSPAIVRQVFLTHTDPAEVVAELRELQLSAHVDSHSEFGGRTDEAKEEAFCEAADLVAEKLVGEK